MRAGSLRIRLLGLAVLTIAAGLALSWIALTLLFERHVTRRVDAELANSIDQIAASLDASQPDMRLLVNPADPQFQRPFGGLYWEIRSEDAAPLRSRSLWDETLPDPPAGASSPTSYDAHGLEGRSLLLRAERVRLPRDGGERTVQIIVAADRATVDDAVAAYGYDLAAALTLIGVCLSGAATLQVILGLAPLTTLRAEVADVRARRKFRLDLNMPTEVQPLVDEVNGLLSAQDEALTRARARASDLAHGLKTPLTVLLAVARGLDRRGIKDEAAEILAQVEMMRRRIDRQLARARLGMDQLATSRIGTLIERMAALMARGPRGRTLDWQLELESDWIVSADEVDVAEVLGNLLDNASKWARATVRITACKEDGAVVVRVEDDGPGVPEPKLQDILARGLRLDSEADGSGLGLAIVRDIVDAYKGELVLGPSTLGGLSVSVAFPVARNTVPPEEGTKLTRARAGSGLVQT